MEVEGDTSSQNTNEEGNNLTIHDNNLELNDCYHATVLRLITNDDIMPFSLPLASVYGEVYDLSNSLFNNQDHWNMYNDTYHLPSRPNKAPMKKETYFSKNHFSENLLDHSAK